MKRIIIAFGCFCAATVGFAQEDEAASIKNLEQRTQTVEDAVKVLQRLKVSGSIQAQYQWGERDAALKVGRANTNPEESFNRIGIRRGRIKLTYDYSSVSGVFQIDITERGVGVKDAYLAAKDPWFGTNVLKAGIFDRPFGHEISYSSSHRESPERSTVFQLLFPEERDMGASLVLKAPKDSPMSFLTLEAGLFSGNGIKEDSDNRKDFIGHLFATGKVSDFADWGLGASYYYGGVLQGNENVYRMSGNAFIVDNAPGNKGKFAKREYFGIDGQFSLKGLFGITQIRAEYLTGTQPGTSAGSKSPNSSTPTVADTYIRNFNGGYITLVQDLGRLPLSAVMKYDWYDSNTKVSGDNVGQNGTGSADLAQYTFGFGALWHINTALRLQAFYEINKNETTQSLPFFASDVDDDVFTLRLQYRF